MTEQAMTTCSTCRFFAPIEGVNGESGECHRYPPTSHPRVMGDEGDEPTQFPQFPQLYATDWCGEHQQAVIPEAPVGNVVVHEPHVQCKGCGHGLGLHSSTGDAQDPDAPPVEFCSALVPALEPEEQAHYCRCQGFQPSPSLV